LLVGRCQGRVIDAQTPASLSDSQTPRRRKGALVDFVGVISVPGSAGVLAGAALLYLLVAGFARVAAFASTTSTCDVGDGSGSHGAAANHDTLLPCIIKIGYTGRA
jgi:hypothetical protein